MGMPRRIEGIIRELPGVSARAISLLALSAGSARAAAPFGIPDGMSGLLAAGGLAGFAAGLVLFLAARRKVRHAEGLREQISELEHRLTETENLLAAEPHAMIVWEGGEDAPSHVSARLHVVSSVPRSEERLVRFSEWLEEDSAERLEEALHGLRTTGEPFNIAVRTTGGDLLEADGRAAGYSIVLRFRVPVGERRAAMEMVCDTRRLNEQVERLSGILDTAPLPVWLRDADGDLLWANAAWLEALEQKDLDMAAAAGLQLVKPEDMHLVHRDEKTGLSVFHGSTVIRGEKRILEVHEMPQEGGVACWAVDITNVHRLQEELKNHIAAHTGTLDRLLTAIAIFGQDRRLLFCNAAFARLWKLDKEWLEEGVTWDEILARLREMRSLPEQADFRTWKERQLEVFTALEGRQEKWPLPDGRFINVIAEPHPQGGVIFVFEDITEKRRLESSYKALMDVQRETLDNLYEAVALFGTDGRLKLFNPSFARFWELDETELADGPHIDRIIERARRLADDDAWWDLLKYSVTGMSERREGRKVRIALKDDRIYECVIVPLPDGNTLVTWYDMSDSARMERALREKNEALMEADRLKSDFLSSVSYELRTPLTSITGFTETLEMGIAGELTPRQKEYVRDIFTASTDLLAAIDTILDLSTIDAGLMELNIDRLDVAEILEGVARRMATRLEQRDLVLEVDLAEDAAFVHADRRRLEQVLANLLSNAITFSSRGGVIRMGARRSGDFVELWIADQGIGMDAETVKKAFQRFSSRPPAGSQQGRGLGLGLPLAKSLVELHGGSMELISRLGEGTTVICRFPVREEGSATLGGTAEADDAGRVAGRTEAS